MYFVIVERGTRQAAIQAGKQHGMVTMDQSLARLAQSGAITMAVALLAMQAADYQSAETHLKRPGADPLANGHHIFARPDRESLGWNARIHSPLLPRSPASRGDRPPRGACRPGRTPRLHDLADDRGETGIRRAPQQTI